MPSERILIYLAVFWYFISAWFSIKMRDTTRYQRSFFFLGLGLIFHTLALVLRTIQADRLPLANLYEFINTFAWFLVLATLIYQRTTFISSITGAISSIGVILLLVAITLPANIGQLPPALQSHWLQIHVLSAILAYGAFAVAFAVSLVLLLKKDGHNTENRNNEKMLYRTIGFGFCFQTLVLITGVVWAEQVWGDWWSWDPKETWALITWLLYAIYLHARLCGYLRGNHGAWFNILAFGVVIFTMLGVSILIPGLHSYR